jgi:type I restriction enzyme S subunit
LHKEAIREFNGVMRTIEPKFINNFSEIRTLEKLRDTFLPKLMSGEVGVEG